MDKTGWCIVAYIGTTPIFYEGYFDLDPNDNKIKPKLSSDFSKAMLCVTKEDAERICQQMKIPNWKVEEHCGYSTGDSTEAPPVSLSALVSQRAKLFKVDSEYVIEYLHQGFIDWAHTNVPECQGDGAQEVLDATIQIIKDGASG